MKSKKDNVSIEENSSASELFNFVESNNENQLLNEDFVFKFEDNKSQSGSEKKNEEESGEEDNDDRKKRKIKIKKKGLSKDDIDKMTNSSSTTTSSTAEAATETATTSAATAGGVSSTVATVATVATTAVVIVVGGSLAIYGQSVEKPSICNFSEIVAVENTIKFTLNLGNNEEQSMLIDGSGEKCDVTIELLCPSYPEFAEEFKVENYGQTSGEFVNLEYDTTYTVNVYQNTLLDINKTYLLDEAKQITIGSPIVQNRIDFDATYDAFDNKEFYSTIHYDGDVSKYEYLSIGVCSLNNQPDGTGDQPEYLAMYEVSKEHPFERAKASLSDLENYDETYRVDFLAEGQSESPTGEYTRVVLLSTEVNFFRISPTPYSKENDIAFEYEYDGMDTTYFAFAKYKGDDNTYDYYTLDVHYIDETPMDELIASNRIELGTRSTYPINFGNYSIYLKYTVMLIGYMNSGGPAAEAVELLRTNVVFGELPKHNIPTVNNISFDKYVSNYEHNDAVIIIDKFDPDNEIQNMKVLISSDGGQSFDSYDVIQGFDCEVIADYIYTDGIYYVKLVGQVKGIEKELYSNPEFEIPPNNGTLYPGATSFSIGSSVSGLEFTVNKGSKSDYVNWRVNFYLAEDGTEFSVDVLESGSSAYEVPTPVDVEFDTSKTWYVSTYACPYDGAEEQIILGEYIDFSMIH